jgi:uncharacterized protein (DUF433 family)
MAEWEMPAAEPPPLRVDAEGTVRFCGSRVTLDTVIGAFNDGDTAEEIMQSYPTLKLADIYAVIAYYLRHREKVDAFLEEQRQEAEDLRRKIEEWCPPDGYRERLLARRAQQS